MKIENDKYYTPAHIAKHCIEKVYEIIGMNNISEFIEPSAGTGVFLQYLNKPYTAYDIEPQGYNITKSDFLKLPLEYKKSLCVIGNPPFGGSNKNNNIFLDFLNKSACIGDYIAFILPVSQYKNDLFFYKFNLVYSEDLGEQTYTDRELRCCFNIYKRPSNGINKHRTNYNLKCVKILEHHRTRTPILSNLGIDYRICSYGNIGKECDPNTYCKEYCFVIDKSFKNKVINLLKNTDYNKEFPNISTPYLQKWRLYKYLKENISGIY